jgi:hypothetical protein
VRTRGDRQTEVGEDEPFAFIDLRPLLIGRHEGLVLVQGRPTEGAIEYSDGDEDHARSDLDEVSVLPIVSV